MEKKNFIVYRETQPGLPKIIRERVIIDAVEGLKFQLKTIKVDKNNSEFLKYINSIITGFDDISMSAVIGVVYNVPNDEEDDAFKKWAFEKLFDYLLSGTWDREYKGLSNLEYFTDDFRLYKKFSI